MSLWGFKIEGVGKIGKIGEVGKGVFFLSRTISRLFLYNGFTVFFRCTLQPEKQKECFGQNRAKTVLNGCQDGKLKNSTHIRTIHQATFHIATSQRGGTPYQYGGP